MKTEKAPKERSTKKKVPAAQRTRAYKRLALQELFEEKITVQGFLKKHNISKSTLNQWKVQVNLEGPDPLISRRILPEELKKKIVREVVSGKLTIEEAKTVYKIPRTLLIKTWCSKYSCELEEPSTTAMKKQESTNHSSEASDRVKELEKALEEAKLKILGLQTLIDVAEKELKIDIRKKPGTKQ